MGVYPKDAGASTPMTRVIDRLTAGGYDPRPAGPGKYESRCPGHKGDRRNLSIREADDGTVLLRCHHADESGRSCPAAAIVAELGLAMADLFPPKDGQPGPKAKTKAKANGKPPGYPTAEAAKAWLARTVGPPTATWIYQRADRTEHGQVVRLDPPAGADGTKPKKQFRPLHRDSASGRWRIADPPGLWPLYRLPELMQADPRRVFLLEGEKCCDLARSLGLAATTTAHGAQSPEKTDLGPLAGREVVLLPDTGPAGDGYATNLLGLLAQLDPKPVVKVVRLPGLAENGDDIEQWIERRDAQSFEDLKAEIEALASEAPVEDAPAETEETEAAGCNGESEPSRAEEKRAEGTPDLDLGLGKRPRTDLGNAERLVARHGHDLRFCHPWSKWLVWDGRRWSLNQTGAARRRARNTVRAIGREAAAQGNGKRRKALLLWALTSEKRDKLSALLHLAEAEEGIPILPEDLNSDPWLFNCRNGTIDLRNGRLRPHRREDGITQLCPFDYDPDAPCPLWLETLSLFLHRDDPQIKAELTGYFQRLCGYALAGVIRDHILPVAYGTGSNGKSTILGALMEVFGPDYAMKCPPDLLMAKKTDSHPTGRADLFGKRLVVAIETEAGRRLNETMVKELTGGDPIRARRMREDFWEFLPTHTLFMATNHKPMIRGTDHGIWRRLKLLGFTVSIGDARADKAMPEKLRGEWSGILAWCVRGCLEWQMRGLDAPAEVTRATAGYRREQDLLGAFLDECTVSGPSYRARASALYARYKTWAEASGEFVETQTMFSLTLQERGFEKKESHGMWYLGIGLVDSKASRTEESKPESDGDDPS